ncbi:DUF5641 domain-containing protein [Trichonephila clavipes]|nr:DUF5641 domain-containing protein [Trichonephila clavipes]
MYDVETRKALEVKDLKDFMRVEIMKKNHSPITRTIEKGYPSNASTSKIPNLEVLNKKLMDNSALNGLERMYLIECLKNFSDPLKHENGTVAVNQDHARMKNRKVKLCPQKLTSYRTTSTQTDELINYQLPLNKTTLTNDIIKQSKQLAALEKVDSAKATDLMIQSFHKRRNFIFIENPAVSFVKERYPLLFSCTEWVDKWIPSLLGNWTLGVSLQTNHLTEASAHAPQCLRSHKLRHSWP